MSKPVFRIADNAPVAVGDKVFCLDTRWRRITQRRIGRQGNRYGSGFIRCEPMQLHPECVIAKECYPTMRLALEGTIRVLERSIKASKQSIARNRKEIEKIRAKLTRKG